MLLLHCTSLKNIKWYTLYATAFYFESDVSPSILHYPQCKLFDSYTLRKTPLYVVFTGLLCDLLDFTKRRFVECLMLYILWGGFDKEEYLLMQMSVIGSNRWKIDKKKIYLGTIETLFVTQSIGKGLLLFFKHILWWPLFRCHWKKQ